MSVLVQLDAKDQLLSPVSPAERDLALKALDRQDASSSAENVHVNGGHQQYRVYNWRWYVLGVVASLNCVNALSWIAYAPVANRVDEYYGNVETANYLTLTFLILAVPVGLVAMWSASRFGIRSAILLGSWFNGIGALIRLASSLEFVDFKARRPLVIFGQCVAACAYPFVMFLPTKTAASWFPDTQRALANSVGTLANPLGVLLAMLISPNFVRQTSDILYLNLLIAVLSIVTCIFATLGVRSSQPPTPPTRAAAQDSRPFFQGLKKLITSRSFLILLLSLGSGIGMFNALYGMMQQLLCSRGYTNSFAGLCCVLMIVGGFLGAFSSAVVVDKTKKFVEVMKLAFILAVLAGIVFSVCALKPDLAPAIGVSCFVFGFFGLAAYPIGMEMAVECSFPVAETTSAGLIVLGGQILGTVYMIGMQTLRSPLTGNDTLIETCSTHGQESSTLASTVALDQLSTTTFTPAFTTAIHRDSSTGAPSSLSGAITAHDMTTPMVVFCLTAGLVVLFFVLAFRPKLRRLKIERQSAAEGTDRRRRSRPISGEANVSADEFGKPLAQEMVDLNALKQSRRLKVDSTQ